MTEKFLLIKAKGGLGNRMLSAISGLIYADLSGRVPVIDWRDGTYAPWGENAYPNLFQAPVMSDLLEVEAISDVTPAIWKGNLNERAAIMVQKNDPDKHSSALIYRKYCVDLSRLDQPHQVAVFMSYLPKLGRLQRHMRADARFRGRSWDDIMSDYLARWFQPNARVSEGVSVTIDRIPKPIIGVHVRYTDLKVPLEPIKAALRRQLQRWPEASIFLATDNADVQAEFKTDFVNVYHIDKALLPGGEKLHKASHDFDKQIEAENALIDMWALSRCDHLIYSRNSTFALTAALIGRLKRGQQNDVDRWNLPVVGKRILQDFL
jgi:hypothetical protein